MYEAFYKLKENPFRLTPDPGYMYMTPHHREALAGLFYSAYTRPGLTVLVGEAGTGKTTLLHALLRALEKGRFAVAFCNNPTLNRKEFYDIVLAKLNVDCGSLLKSRQLIALQDSLLRYREEGRRPVLIVDEAQKLSPELLEEIRLLLNLETPREKLLDIIIAGQPELADMLHRPDLRQLKQRISRICKLEPLGLHELKNYLTHRLAHAGLNPNQKLFSDETIPLMYEITQGIPRLVNSLCDAALQTGFAAQSPRITPVILREAARDLELTARAVATTSANGTAHELSPALPAPAAFATAAAPPVNGWIHRQRDEEREDPDYDVRERKKSGFLANLIGRWKE
jgi:general secretion pathway protein A